MARVNGVTAADLILCSAESCTLSILVIVYLHPEEKLEACGQYWAQRYFIAGLAGYILYCSLCTKLKTYWFRDSDSKCKFQSGTWTRSYVWRLRWWNADYNRCFMVGHYLNNIVDVVCSHSTPGLHPRLYRVQITMHCIQGLSWWSCWTEEEIYVEEMLLFLLHCCTIEIVCGR